LLLPEDTETLHGLEETDGTGDGANGDGVSKLLSIRPSVSSPWLKSFSVSTASHISLSWTKLCPYATHP
jgi:hypothetical protein